MKKKIVNKIIIVILGILIALGILVLLYFRGAFQLNNPSKQQYPVRGVDVSSYQGKIDWNVLSKENIHFAYIKATEGSSYKDPYFNDNYKNSIKTKLKIGAYHFFSFDSDGKKQAVNFIKTVTKNNNALAPVVDVEYYGDKANNRPKKENVEKELLIFINELQKHYNKKPIIYTTHEVYNLYIKDKVNDYDIWIRDVIRKPDLSDGKQWTYWQYSSTIKLKGYSGVEAFIDLNVYNGTSKEFSEYTR